MAAGNQMPSIVTGPWQFVRPRSPGRWTEGMERISQPSLCGKEQTAFRLLVGWMGMDGGILRKRGLGCGLSFFSLTETGCFAASSLPG
ncbi:hypothetical protein CCHR01_07332 [Colletotrichum chrysophilum]|uniref:Uncharacterized protein n=1 Tax=Colletotrichum chrysophilum TaxID=1836956 RepID=A0AAD9EIW5_9PEZI|nr:hypothetical protein CCHR01_07332 [Colletotrichum chrysophilum]